MATNKLLKPTNVTISIPEFTDQPDQRVNSNCIDKEADAINSLNDQIANNYTHYTLFASSNLELVNDASITLTDDRRNYRELVFIYRYSATGTFYERHFYWEDASYITLDTIFGDSCWAYISRVDYTHFKVSGGSATNRPFLTKIYGIK